jgi:hypothetical protein
MYVYLINILNMKWPSFVVLWHECAVGDLSVFAFSPVFNKTNVTERRGRVVGTPSYSGGPVFKSRPGDPASWLRFFVFFSPSRKVPGYYLQIRLQPLPSTYFSIHHSSSLSFDAKKSSVAHKASLNKLQINKIRRAWLLVNHCILGCCSYRPSDAW